MELSDIMDGGGLGSLSNQTLMNQMCFYSNNFFFYSLSVILQNRQSLHHRFLVDYRRFYFMVYEYRSYTKNLRNLGDGTETFVFGIANSIVKM